MLAQFWEHQSAFKNLYSLHINPLCQKYHLTRTEMDILLFLANNPQFDTATDIVEHKGLSKSHVSTSLRTLEDKGYLKSSYHGRNRRTIHLEILESAQLIVREGQQAQSDYYAILFNNFTDQEKDILIRMIRKMADNVQQHLGKD